jgi:serine/threonine protein kinase
LSMEESSTSSSSSSSPTSSPPSSPRYTTKYDIVLGSGTYANVYLGSFDDKDVAIKSFKNAFAGDHECSVCDFIRPYKFPEIVEIIDVVLDPNPEIVLELLKGKDVLTRLMAKRKFSEKNATKIIKSVLNGLKNMHEKCHIIHGDVKTENIVFVHDDENVEKVTEDEYWRCKLVDFGFSIMLNENTINSKHKMQQNVGTDAYLCPESKLLKVYSTKTDSWSVGMTTFLLLFGFFPFNISEPRVFLMQLQKESYFVNKVLSSKIWSAVSPEAKDFISKLMIYDPDKRYSIRFVKIYI